jgi:hypothetical protein
MASGSRECAPDDMLREAIHLATQRRMDCFVAFGHFGYLNSGAAFSASLVVFIDASHLSFLLS